MRFQANNDAVFGCDLAILFASYEPRCVEIAKRLAKAKFDRPAIVFFCSDLPSTGTNANLSAIQKLLGQRAIAIPVSYSNPAPMIQAVNQLPNVASILIDVSCFNRGNLFPFLWASGFGKTKFPELSFGYSPPQEYGTWLSRDHAPPCNILGFPGSIEFPSERLLICAVGYEAERAMAVIAAAEPSQVVLTVGSIPTRDEFLARNRKVVELVHGSTDYEVIPINVSDPESCMQDFFWILRRATTGANIAFAPFSTKLSCLAIWGLWLKNKNIRIWNAQPTVYNISSYSKGSRSPLYYTVNWDNGLNSPT